MFPLMLAGKAEAHQRGGRESGSSKGYPGPGQQQGTEQIQVLEALQACVGACVGKEQEMSWLLLSTAGRHRRLPT